MTVTTPPAPPIASIRDIVGLAFYNRNLIVTAFLVVFAVGVVAAVVAKTYFTAEARLLLLVGDQQTGGAGAGPAGPTVLSLDAQRVVEGEVNIVLSRAAISAMIQSIGPLVLYPELGERRWFGLLPPYPEVEQVGRAAERIVRDLKAESLKDSTVMGISYRHPDADLAASVVNELIKQYLNLRRTVYDAPATPFLTNERDRFADQLKRLDQQVKDIKTKFQVVDLPHEILLAVNQVDNVVQRRRQLQERGAALVAEVETAKQRYATMPARVFDFAETSNQTQNNDDHNVLLRLLLDEEKLSRLYTADYPPLIDIRHQIDVVRASMRSKDKPTFDTRRDVRNPSLDFLANQLIQLEAESDAVVRQLKELDDQQTSANKRVASLRDADDQLVEVIRSRDLVETIYKDYARRTEAARIDEAAAKTEFANVRVAQWAAVPVIGATMAPSLVAAGLLGGVLAAVAAGIAAGWMRSSFILPGEAERRLNLATLAVMTQRGGEILPDDEVAVLTARLAENAQKPDGLKLFQFAAVSEADQPGPTVWRIARELAEDQLVRVLLIDLTETTSRRTVGEAMRIDGLTWRASNVERLSIASKDGPNIFANTRAARRMLRNTLVQLKERFDLVLIVPPSLTAGPTLERLAPLVDATTLIIRAEHTRVLAAMRLRDAVLAADGDLYGLIFTDRQYHVPEGIVRWL